LTTPLDVAALDSHLNRLRKDIYEAGSGVDTQEISLGNASGVALKFRYADLDTDTDDMASEFAASLEELIWFIKVDLLNKGLGDFLETKFDIIFNTDGIINESEVIMDARNSVGIISDETIRANHPWVTDAQEEGDRMSKESEEKMKQMQEVMAEGAVPGFGEEASDEGGEE
jgi:SPP1 family phage portal protein